MSSINKVMLLGNLGKDPELNETLARPMCKFPIATSEKWKDQSGQMQTKTEWHNIVVWGNQATACAKYLAKGRQVHVEGKIKTREWKDNSGNSKFFTEIDATAVTFVNATKDMGEKNNSSDSDFGSFNEMFGDHK